jgi:hypothetical protein
MKNDSAIKLIGYSVLGLIAFWLVDSVLFPSGYGVSVSYNMPGHFRSGYEHGYVFNYGLTGFTGLIIQILLVALFLALLVGVIMVVKNYFFTQENIAAIKASLIQATKPCVECGKDLNPDWKVCPHCGKAVDNPEKQ